MKPFDAVVAGHICLDMILQIPAGDLRSLTIPGKLVEIGPANFCTGGAVSNTGRTLHRLGINTRLMGKVGSDQFGDIILDLLRRDSPEMTVDMIVAPGETSSYTIVISPPGMDRTFLHCGGANHTFGPEDVPYERLKQAHLFHFGYPPLMKRFYANDGAELIELFCRVRKLGLLTSLDMALPDPKSSGGHVNWPLLLQRTLPYVDLFLPSLDELLFMVRRGVDPHDSLISEVAVEMHDLGARVVVLKLGDRGLYLRTGPDGLPGSDDPGWKNRELWSPCFVPEPLVGTTGAGDATIAGFLAAVLRGLPVEQAITAAVAVGACNVEASDALSGVRSWEATQTRIQAGWRRAPLQIDAPGWVWMAEYGLWAGPDDHRVG